MLRRHSLNVLACFVTLLSISGALRGQAGNGIVKGTLQDASGAIISGASIRLTNLNTNVARTADTSAEGLYYFGSIPPGPYQLEVAHSGFEKWTGTFTVQVAQTVVVDPQLKVGNVENTVVVSDVAPVVTTEGMSVADVKDALRIRQLPLNGRQISNLFNLTPGVEGGGAPRVSGLNVGAAESTQDGVTIVDRFSGGIQRVQPGLDTVQEFRIETNGSNAKYPRPATVT